MDMAVVQATLNGTVVTDVDRLVIHRTEPGDRDGRVPPFLLKERTATVTQLGAEHVSEPLESIDDPLFGLVI